MKSIIPIIALFLAIASCTNSKKQLTVRDTAISLIEKEYPANGRRLEYSQIDSTDAELKGYTVYRIYINNNDSIRLESFHLNYNKTNINKTDSFTIEPDIYKTFLVSDKVFTNDYSSDLNRIGLIHIPSAKEIKEANDIRMADSIAAVEAAAVKAGIY